MADVIRPFQPIPGGTIRVNHSVTDVADIAIPESANVLAFWNASQTATAYVRCQPAIAGAVTATIPTAGGANGDMPIPPQFSFRLSIPFGAKNFSLISDAADSFIDVTPGIGN